MDLRKFYEKLWKEQERKQEEKRQEEYKQVKQGEIQEDLKTFDFSLSPENSNKSCVYIRVNGQGLF